MKDTSQARMESANTVVDLEKYDVSMVNYKLNVSCNFTLILIKYKALVGTTLLSADVSLTHSS